MRHSRRLDASGSSAVIGEGETVSTLLQEGQTVQLLVLDLLV